MKNLNKLLQIRNLKKVYGSGQNSTHALRGMNLDVIPGEFLGIMGPSGSGKTTLLNCVATMIKPTSGEIILDEMDITKLWGDELSNYRGNKIGYLFQEFELLDNLTSEENIILPLSIHNESRKKMDMKLKRIAEQLDIVDILKKFPSQLSGGQKQRVAASRALITNPAIVLADEPTGSLDSKNGRILMEKLSYINKEEGSSILMVTHDANAASYCSRILFIQDGLVFHELRREIPEESQEKFYERIIDIMGQLGGGSKNVLTFNKG
ncbi:ABC transporter ATP-binding protein [Miniphocaeibacter halophilus]|uniref:ABC transporter ATP-binding protein n=1 Tax=Miniphocaeibacter halophilus TaxID=2931922 RepID=A0AC61MX87_9FIRM|nr:ABC transporter ATP-binding protein [Miniphocaeibacter halophilus]QQK08580.1 ABC transporter ATP-binding protein [Miniphocaeibacter halophilus]